MIRLSILVPSTNTRFDSFLPIIKKQLYSQYDDLTDNEKQRVEILFLVDNKQMMLGHKRNVMVNMAQGKYVVHVDDDDRVAPDYIKSLLYATDSDADCIVFQAEVRVNDEEPKICYYSKDNKTDFNKDNSFYRIPNHICCIKKEVSMKSSFPNIMYGEDSGYSKVLLPNLKTEHKIDRVLYYYDYSVETSETQTHKPNKSTSSKLPPIVDVVMLSKSLTRQQIIMTQNAIKSCIRGANGLSVGITVIEQGSHRYRGANTVHKPEKFNYNAFANYGASLGTAPWIMIANNDLTFKDGWLHALLAADNPVVSPHEPNDVRQRDIIENTMGYENGKHFSGWCFMVSRKLWREIGHFDDCVDFWCSDDVVIEQVKAAGITPMLVKGSIVRHTGSVTLKSQSAEDKNELKWRNVFIYNTKYKKDKFAGHPSYTNWIEQNKEYTDGFIK